MSFAKVYPDIALTTKEMDSVAGSLADQKGIISYKEFFRNITVADGAFGKLVDLERRVIIAVVPYIFSCDSSSSSSSSSSSNMMVVMDGWMGEWMGVQQQLLIISNFCLQYEKRILLCRYHIDINL